MEVLVGACGGERVGRGAQPRGGRAQLVERIRVVGWRVPDPHALEDQLGGMELAQLGEVEVEVEIGGSHGGEAMEGP